MRFRTRAKTAYGVLSEVRRLILDEPLRYDQTVLLVRRDEGYSRPMGFPKCGTVGCRAGWVTELCARYPESVLDPWGSKYNKQLRETKIQTTLWRWYHLISSGGRRRIV